MSYEEVNEKATNLLSLIGFDKPPINALKIAEELGIRIKFFKHKTDVDNIDFSCGFYSCKDHSIYVDDEESSNRKNFIIARSIGNYCLSSIEGLKLERHSLLLNKDDEKEKELDDFADNLLVPEIMLKRYYQLCNIDRLSVLFCAPRIVINRQIKKMR